MTGYITSSWLAALRPGGRLVTVITGTNLLLTATATGDSGAEGQIEWEHATFMPALPAGVLPPDQEAMLAAVRDRAEDGHEVTRGRYPIGRVPSFGEIASMLEVLTSGTVHDYQENAEGERTAWMTRSDGSWARAGAPGDDPAVVDQGGPRRLRICWRRFATTGC
ncbi:hypothetical protein [Streptosporangium canum]|uniref:hypothetical protein n=1 Tax=Streptosporangium canum TaxID=324952 RepID=UPI0037921100